MYTRIKNIFKTLQYITLGLVITLCVSPMVFGQVQQAASVIHDLHIIKSQVLNEERTILVRVPGNYTKSNEKFPVVYMLDAHTPYNSMMAGMMEQQAWSSQMPEMILVGIQNTNRVRDFTPTKTERLNSGGSDKFLEFIEKEVITFVEENYRTQPYRIFVGHSLGGLLVFYTFISQPNMFNAYIAASPVLHWDKDFVIKRAEEVFKQKKEYKKTLFFAIGDEPDYVNSFNSLKNLLKKTAPKNLEYGFNQMIEETHGSVVLPAYYQGLRKVFSGWLPQSENISDLENHYKKLSERFGYQINIPENSLNQIGYQFLDLKKIEEAIEVFKKNSQLYPNSANVYHSLAEAFEKNGQLKQAKENYEKAYKMAEAQANLQLAKIAKDSYQRVSAKLK